MSMANMQVIFEGNVYYRYEDVLKNMFGVDKKGVLQPVELEGLSGRWIEQDNAQKACRFNKVRPVAVFNYEWEKEKKLEISAKVAQMLNDTGEMFCDERVIERVLEESESEVNETVRKLKFQIAKCKEAKVFIDSFNEKFAKLQSHLRIRQYISMNRLHELDQQLMLTGNGVFIELFWYELEDLERTFFLPAIDEFPLFSAKRTKALPDQFDKEKLYVCEIDHPDELMEISLYDEEDPINYDQTFMNVAFEVLNRRSDIDSIEYGWKIYNFFSQDGKINFFLTENELEQHTLQCIDQRFNRSNDQRYAITYEEMLRIEKPITEMLGTNPNPNIIKLH